MGSGPGDPSGIDAPVRLHSRETGIGRPALYGAVNKTTGKHGQLEVNAFRNTYVANVIGVTTCTLRQEEAVASPPLDLLKLSVFH